MVEQAGAQPSDAETSLADSRAQFVASLGRRLEALRQALFALEQAPKSAPLRDHLRRRIHAFGAAAGVLGFDRVFDAFREAEAVLGRTSSTTLGPAELALVARTVDLVPSLVLGAAAPVARAREASAGVERRGGGYPTSLLVFGSAALAEPFERGQSGGDSGAIEIERAEESDRAEAVVRITAPDVAIVDADLKGARELMETLVYDPLLDPVRIVAVGTFDRPEAAASLVALGVARVLPKPVSPDTLRRSVLEVARERSVPVERIDPVGDVTVEALGERIAHEIRRGLVDAVKTQGRAAEVSFGAGTDVLAAVWSAVARIRELVTLRSGGIVRFDASGPEGAVPLAPWMGDERTRGPGADGRSADGVSLEGRTVIVVDDDPAVVWFISGLLRESGAEVIEAHDGEYALDVARKCSPDVIVSDILMPGLDGFALCREIKRDVALSDVPVILLSWKEDLLQRVRELGADAQGYLRKEATAGVVGQRVREVLLPRARIEARLEGGGPARGRLDGLTPRLILELVCKKSVDARLTLRDAAYLYEVEVRGGKVRTATRTSADGRFDRGSRALSALLGVRAGRFAVTRDRSPCVHIWDEELNELIAEHVERARAAQRALADLQRVAQVEVEEGVLEPYLGATPVSAAAIVRRLAEGVPPSDIVAAGASPRLLESVLVDLVLHGAITRIVGFDGEDLLAAAVTSLEESRAKIELTIAKGFRTPGPPAAAAALAALAAREETAEAKTGATPPAASATPSELIAGFDDWEVAARSSPPPASKGAEDLFAILGDSMVPSAMPVEERPESGRASMKGAAPPTSLPAEPSPLETALRSLPASVSSQFWKAQEDPARIVDADAEAPAVAEATRGAPVTQSSIGEQESHDAFAAAVSEPVLQPTLSVDGSTAAAPAESVAIGTTTAVSPVMALPSVTVAEAETEAVPNLAAVQAQQEPPSPFPTTNAAVAMVARVALEAEEAEASASAEAAQKGEEPARTGEPPPSRFSVTMQSVAPPEIQQQTPSETPAARAVESAAKTPEVGAAAAVAPEVELGDAVASAIGGEPPKTLQSSAPPAVERKPSPKGPRTTPPLSRAGGRDARSSSRSPAVPPREATPEATNFLVIVAVMAVAAFATFKIVTAVRTGFATPSPAAVVSVESAPVAPSPPAPASVSPPSPAVATALAPPKLRAADMDLPPGLAVSDDRGLLEVAVDATQSVYVDGVFIGKGPTRQVPLREGAHEIRVQADGLDVVQPVDVRRGRRTHVEVSRAP